MMMIPRKRNEFNLFEDIFDDPFFEKRDSKLMRTDIKEKGENYIIDIDLPGYEKGNIEIELENGYLKVNAKVNKNIDDQNEKYIHKERFYGECRRSFYIGEDILEEDINAEFTNGILKIEVPKKEEQQEKKEIKQITIK